MIMRKSKKIAISITAAAFLSLTGAGVWAYAAPYSYVSLDVNPSIEYTLNVFNRVIDVEAVNEDGEEILEDVGGLKNLTIEDAITKTVDQLAEEGYIVTVAAEAAVEETIQTANGTLDTTTVSGSAITKDSQENRTKDIIVGGIVITISNKDIEITDELADKIRDAVESIVSEEVEVEVMGVGYARVQEARKLGVTPGKLNLVEKLKASTSDPDSIETTEWVNKPVKEIMQAIKANRKAQTISMAIDTPEANTDATKVNSMSTVQSANDAVEVTEDKVDQEEDQDEDQDDKNDRKEVYKSVKKVEKDAKKEAMEAAREADKSSKEAAREAKKLAKEVEKEAEKADKKAEDKAWKADKEDREAEEKDRESIKVIRDASEEDREEASEMNNRKDNMNNYGQTNASDRRNNNQGKEKR